MTRQKKDELDAFARDVEGSASVDGYRSHELSDGLSYVTNELPPIAAAAAFRERLLAAALPEQRLVRYAEPIAALLDVDLAAAEALIARIDDPSAWIEFLPGISLLPTPSGPRARGALRGFVRVRAGVEFPEHSHLGDEAVMIMQGYYSDSVTGAVFGPGDTPRMAVDTHHSFRVLADGPDLLGLVVAFGGLRAQGREFLPF
jgi:anti-sigma factor ChrR (cupin superfamily)